MKKTIFLALVLAFSCRGPEVLEREGWEPSVHKALSTLIRDGGGASCAPYAVFDCDNTSIIHDVSQTLMLYMIENLRFDDAPELLFLGGIEDTSKLLEGWEMSAAEAGKLLAEEYRQLEAMRDGGMDLEEIRKSELYLDFRARFLSFEEQLGLAYSYEDLCIWQPALLCGMSKAEARSLMEESIRHNLSIEPYEEEWTSPDGRFTGIAEIGLKVTQAMKNLHRSLVEHGIDTYICSASLEELVEVLACDPEIGFGMPPERVYGIRLAEGDSIIPAKLEGYPQPYKQGKVENIKAFMAASHCSDGPVLVAGDSNGDVAMLTAFRGTRCSLIMDCGNDGPIGELAAKARSAHNRGRFVVQPRRYARPGRSYSVFPAENHSHSMVVS